VIAPEETNLWVKDLPNAPVPPVISTTLFEKSYMMC
jgi:hypothetical protein